MVYSKRGKGGDKMITRRHLLLAILTTCLVTMFVITTVPIFSQSAGQYDPWLDLNEDGKINIIDISMLAKAFGTSGTPINYTAMLLTLQAEIDSLNSTLATQQSEINNLGAQLATKLGAPDYDSGWVGIAQGQSIVLNHNLGTTNVLVYMMGNSVGGGPTGTYLNQLGIGGVYWSNTYSTGYGAYWWDLTPTYMWVTRLPQDDNYAAIRVQMWKLPS